MERIRKGRYLRLVLSLLLALLLLFTGSAALFPGNAASLVEQDLDVMEKEEPEEQSLEEEKEDSEEEPQEGESSEKENEDADEEESKEDEIEESEEEEQQKETDEEEEMGETDREEEDTEEEEESDEDADNGEEEEEEGTTSEPDEQGEMELEDKDPEEEEPEAQPEEPLADAVLPATAPLESVASLGDWLHYNGIVFGEYIAHAADVEGAIAVGGDAYLGIAGGYDLGASYKYEETVHLGQYTNEEGYPTFLMGGEYLQLGSSDGKSDGSHNVYGGPVVSSQEIYDMHEESVKKFEIVGNDWIIAEQEDLDNWFSQQRKKVDRMVELLLTANEVVVELEDFSKERSTNVYPYIADADKQSKNPYLNTRLTNQSGEVDQNILIITVETDEDIWFSDPWTAYALPISAEWAKQYELIVFNFPNAVNIKMTGDPQVVVNGLGANKTHPDGHVSSEAAAERHAICESVIYNFPQAQQIQMDNVYLMGSLWAPNASLTADGGSINGQLVCQDFETKGKMELHALRLTKYIDEIEPGGEKGYIRLEKYEYAGGPTDKELKDAAFILVRMEDGKEWYYMDNGEFSTSLGKAVHFLTPNTIKEVPPGDYILREIFAPDGYVANRDDPENEYTYFEYAFSVGSEEEVITILRYNEQATADIYFQKVDEDDHTHPLEGAVFALLKEELGDYVYIQTDITSDENGMVYLSGLLPGQYMLRETTPPEGYLALEEAISFTVGENSGTIYLHADGVAGGEGSAEFPYLITNESGTPDNTIHIYKYGVDEDSVGTSHALSGAAFDLYREEPEDSGQWKLLEENDNLLEPQAIAIVTDAAGIYTLANLLPGRYRLVETKAPEGYYPLNPHQDNAFPDGYAHEFHITDEWLEQVESIANYPQQVELELLKTGNPYGTEQPLPGAVFQLTRYYSGNWIPMGSGQTSPDGTASFSGLGEGRYRLEETAAPAGYQLLDPAYLYFDIQFAGDSANPVQVKVYYGGGEEELPVGADTSPVSFVTGEREGVPLLTIKVEDEAYTRGIVVYKIDEDIFQVGTDEDEEKNYQVTYLEGARFQLQRKENGTTGSWKDYGEPFTSEPVYRDDGAGGQVQETDEYGNPKMAAVHGGLIYGTYRLVETTFPEGYRASENSERVTLENGTEGYVVHTFTITEAMAVEGGNSEYTVSNISDKPRGNLLIYKVDSDGSPIAYVPFKLWKISAGAEDWKGDMTLEEVMADFDALRFIKYSAPNGTSSFYTDAKGVLELEGIEPGVYALFEHWNETISAYLKHVLYILSHETTTAEPNDASFYFHLTVFKVVAIDEADPSAGVRIQWVDRNKTWNGEAVFDNEYHNTGQWQPKENEDEHRTLSIVNKILQEVDVTFLKTNQQGEPLEGAEFALYRKNDFMAENGDIDAYTQVDTASSGADGQVTFRGLGAAWRNADGSLVPEGYRTAEEQSVSAEYMIVEAGAPDGYRAGGEALFFRLQLNELSKMLDLYHKDAAGNTTGYQPGYIEPQFDPDTKEVLEKDKDGNPVAKGTFILSFKLPDVQNEKILDFRFRKVSSVSGDPLEGASFSLYQCEEEHTHSDLAEDGSCWRLYKTASSGAEGLVEFDSLPSGRYQLVETAAPAHYDLPDGQWLLTVDADMGDIVIESRGSSPPPAFLWAGASDPDVEYWLLNTHAFDLPITGGEGVEGHHDAGLVFLLAGTVLLIIKRLWDRFIPYHREEKR